MASKMPRRASLWPCIVAKDELVVVEVVAGVHADVCGEALAHFDFEVGAEERDFDAVDLCVRTRG